MKVNATWSALLVGLVLGLSIGAATAVQVQEQLVRITAWPTELNVTVTNLPTVPVDTDGDRVLDALDAFPYDPDLSWTATYEVNATEVDGVKPGTVTMECRTYNETACNLRTGAKRAQIFWETIPIVAGSGSANIEVTHVYTYDGAYTCSPERATFSTDVTRTVRSATHLYRFGSVLITGGLVDFWQCFRGVNIRLWTTSTWSPYLHLRVEFVG